MGSAFGGDIRRVQWSRTAEGAERKTCDLVALSTDTERMARLIFAFAIWRIP